MMGCASRAGNGGAAAGATGGPGAAGVAGAAGSAGAVVGPRDAATTGEAGATTGSSGAAGAITTDGGPGDVAVAPPIVWPNQALLYKATMTAPPKLTDTDETTDAPLLGNGDLGVAIFGGADALTFNLHKNEFWSLSEAKVKAMAQLALAIP
ncbi:MAG TPA: hypothetical protein VLA14_13875, partial [Polyangia bacterium]|nr:hypothetical protein [Polyangia bacterium]